MLLSHQKHEIMPSAATSDGLGGNHTEWMSQTEKQICCDIPYMQNLKGVEQNELILKTETD